jgi:hypothetical protein
MPIYGYKSSASHLHNKILITVYMSNAYILCIFGSFLREHFFSLYKTTVAGTVYPYDSDSEISRDTKI